MKKSMKGEAVLSKYQMQAIRLNNLEYHRLHQNVNLLNDNLQQNLSHLQRQAQSLKYHFANVVKVVKPNPSYELWKKVHAYKIAQDEINNWKESMKHKKKPKPKIRQQAPLPIINEIPSESGRPLLLLVDNGIEKPNEPIINFGENYLRPKTSPVKNHLPNQHRVNPLLAMLNEPAVKSTNHIQEQSSESDSVPFLSPVVPKGSRRLIQNKIMTVQNPSNLDTLYRIALQNQTAYKSVERTRIEERKLVDKQFASQHRALNGTMRSTGLVK